MKKLTLNYDDAMLELQGILERMQSGDTSLEAMQEETKRALALIKHCRERLRSIGQSLEDLFSETEGANE
ncbi:MAG: exodeoxyribonuclease VII small subunit [Saprospiraceae bacterium]|jgi:exodeoxyribonuclease VII small subunit|nr:exodeoxyribonuclease VII small subunit [Saprospiraceae bacterium]